MFRRVFLTWKDYFKNILGVFQRCSEYETKFLPAISEVVKWISNRQFTDCSEPDSYGAVKAQDGVMPLYGYFPVHPQRANLGLTGLLQYTGADVDVLGVARRWIEWYLRHIDDDRPGIVYNHYYLPDGTDERIELDANPLTGAQAKEPISEDDTAAPTFLSLVWEYSKRGGVRTS